MGIPVYFKTLVQEYQDSILIKNKLTSVKALFLDLNCAIHPCCSGESDEEIMLTKIISKIDELVQYTNVEDLLYIAVDGIPPKGKMKQQRMRRYKSMYENKVWNTNAISPGTRFMDKLNKRLKTIKSEKFKIIISDTTERGEGEHKILQYIKTHELTNSVIYGLDADLIMLSIVSQKDNIYLLRERTEYNIEDTDNDYIYMNIDRLKEYILKDLMNDTILKYKKEEILNDYIFICFLLGNDFINHIHSLSLRYNGYDYLIETYKILQERYSGYFRLIDLRLDNCIHLTFFKEFIRELSLREDSLLEKRKVIRDKQYKIAYSKYGCIYDEFMKFISDKDLMDKNLTIETIHNFEMSKLHDSNEYEMTKEMINNLPILMWPEEKKLKNNYEEDICDDYLASLIWTSHYYFKECVHWRWSTFYDNTPSLKDLSTYLEKTNSLSFNSENKEYTIEELLKFIFPNESHKLHNYKIKSKNYELYVEPFYHRYLWECPIKFI